VPEIAGRQISIIKHEAQSSRHHSHEKSRPEARQSIVVPRVRNALFWRKGRAL